MLIPKLIPLTLAAGALGGVTENKRVSATRINAVRIEVNNPTGNGGVIRVGMDDYNLNTGAFTALPASPALTNATAIATIPVGSSYVFELDSHSALKGETFDVSKFSVQGPNATDVVQFVVYVARPK